MGLSWAIEQKRDLVDERLVDGFGRGAAFGWLGPTRKRRERGSDGDGEC
jgi:hypothetical protein